MSQRLKEWAKELSLGEKGVAYKDRRGKLKVALVYPNTYYIGMSNLGFQTIYYLLNQQEDVVCERAFLPDRDIIEEFIRTNTPLFSLESRRPLREFDILAFSISFEEDYPNILKILSLARIPLLSSERDMPLVIGGGVITFINPEPIAEFFDALLIGEGEGIIAEFVNLLIKHKGRDKQRILKELLNIDCIYCPSFYEPVYNRDDTLNSLISHSGAPHRVKRRRVEVKDLSIPTPVLTHHTEFSSRFLIEVSRGCPRGCRFCAAGFVYLPPRERINEVLREGLTMAFETTDKIGLLGTSVSEHPSLYELVSLCLEEGGDVSISSMRVDTITKDGIRLLKKGGYRTFTIAPEAGSERLRRVINKPYTDEDIFNAIELLSDEGVERVKLYYMFGLPTEKEEDIEALIGFNMKLKERLKGGVLTIKITPFVPKPWTPFQWHPYTDIKVLKKRASTLRKGLAVRKGIKLNISSIEGGYIQTLLSLGDRRVGRALVEASKGLGIKRAIKFIFPHPDFYVYREKGKDEVFPWDFIDQGLRKGYLYNEYQRGLKGLVTPPCDLGRCVRCGVCGEDESSLPFLS